MVSPVELPLPPLLPLVPLPLPPLLPLVPPPLLPLPLPPLVSLPLPLVALAPVEVPPLESVADDPPSSPAQAVSADAEPITRAPRPTARGSERAQDMDKRPRGRRIPEV